MRHTLIHPKLRGHIDIVWPSRCTLQDVIFTEGVSGQPVPTGAIDVAGMQDVPCILGPVLVPRVSDNEVRTSNLQSEVVRRICKLNGYFPFITIRTQQVIVDGDTYQIRGVECDYTSSPHSTRLSIEIVRPL